MSQQRNVTASFYIGDPLSLTYTKAGAGTGSVGFSVEGSTATCSDTCTQTYWKNATIMLSAQPDPGSYFKGWSGTCRGPKTYCSVRLGRAKNVTAVFERLPIHTLTYTKEGTGSGVVTDGGSGAMNCTDSCTNTIADGTRLSVSAVAASGSEFVGWGGYCQGPKQTCSFTVRGDINLSATFRTNAKASAGR
ncbi:hypothetical protein [Aestuariivirga sp.]|uniref:InlB B-repeat-containing protein n=1 Tax=Aestuariivirga sp. TaxID=2650926 RepID=UPI0025B95158|nr:hypothetical protein [Aestuariivirga sp.]